MHTMIYSPPGADPGFSNRGAQKNCARSPHNEREVPCGRGPDGLWSLDTVLSCYINSPRTIFRSFEKLQSNIDQAAETF